MTENIARQPQGIPAGGYVDSLGDATNLVETEAREAFHELRGQFEAEKEFLDDKTLRDRKFQVAQQANWVSEYRTSSYNKRLIGETS